MKDYKLTLVENKQVAQDIYKLTLSGLDKQFFDEFAPGQFAHADVPNAPHLLLRRPISIHSVDQSKGTMTLCCTVVGEGTQRLCSAHTGETIRTVAPIGEGYPMEESFKNIFLLGGGMGVAPLLAAPQQYPKLKYTAFLGWRDCAHVYAIDSFLQEVSAVEAFTDDGSAFEKGFALDGLLKRIESGEKPDVIFACGPLPMLRMLQRKLPADVPCFVSLEERMGCGVGGCLTCTCKIKIGNNMKHQRVCIDGPVFALSEVLFDD